MVVPSPLPLLHRHCRDAVGGANVYRRERLGLCTSSISDSFAQLEDGEESHD